MPRIWLGKTARAFGGRRKAGPIPSVQHQQTDDIGRILRRGLVQGFLKAGDLLGRQIAFPAFLGVPVGVEGGVALQQAPADRRGEDGRAGRDGAVGGHRIALGHGMVHVLDVLAADLGDAFAAEVRGDVVLEQQAAQLQRPRPIAPLHHFVKPALGEHLKGGIGLGLDLAGLLALLGHVAAKVGIGDQLTRLDPGLVERDLAAQPYRHPAFLAAAHPHLDDPGLYAGGGDADGKAGDFRIPEERLPLGGRLEVIDDGLGQFDAGHGKLSAHGCLHGRGVGLVGFTPDSRELPRCLVSLHVS